MVILSKCSECKHFHVTSKKLDYDAYPKGIPIEVFKSAETVRCSATINFEPIEEPKTE